MTTSLHRSPRPDPHFRARRPSRPCRAWTSTSPRASWSPSSAPTAPASRPACGCSPRCSPRPAARATVAGCDIATDPAGVRRRIGYVGQGNGAGHAQRVRDELVSQGRGYGLRRREARARAGELLDALELPTLAGPEGADAVRRPAPPARRRARAGAPAGPAVPGRAVDRAGPAEPGQPVGAHPAAAGRARDDGLPHHALPGRGRHDGRAGDGHRPRPGDRRRHRGAAEGRARRRADRRPRGHPGRRGAGWPRRSRPRRPTSRSTARR